MPVWSRLLSQLEYFVIVVVLPFDAIQVELLEIAKNIPDIVLMVIPHDLKVFLKVKCRLRLWVDGHAAR